MTYTQRTYRFGMQNKLHAAIGLLLLFAINLCSAVTCISEKLDGSGALDFAQFQGRLVYVDFWASWCGPCQRSFPYMNSLKKQFAGKELTVIAITVDKNINDAMTFLKDHPADFIVTSDTDGKCAKEMQVKGMPSSYILGKNGEIVFTHKGFRPSDTDLITQHLQSLIEEVGR